MMLQIKTQKDRISLFRPDLGVAMGVTMGVAGNSVPFNVAINLEHFPLAL